MLPSGRSGHDSQMVDLILRNARLAGQDALGDIGVEAGRIVTVEDGAAAKEVIDLGGAW